MFEEDYIIKSIKAIIQTLARIFFKKDMIEYELKEEKQDVDFLHLKLLGLLNDGDINTAENILFSSLDIRNSDYLKVGIDFYSRINELSNEELREWNFSRDEVKDGLIDLSKKFGVNMWN